MLFLLEGSAEVADWRYIQPAIYRAGSTVNDPKAVGGYGRSNRFPEPVSDRKRLNGRLNAVLSNDNGNLSIYVTNGSSEYLWLPARDSLLHAGLEAKDQNGRWRPIEYDWTVQCGASWHRVILPPAYEWSYRKTLPVGRFQTTIRLRIKTDGGETYSNEVPATLFKERFTQSTESKKKNTIILQNNWATKFLGYIPPSFLKERNLVALD